MAEVKIQIENTKLANLGIDQEPEYTILKFRDSAFIGYWVCDSLDIPGTKIIKAYIGNEEYLCCYCEKNIILFDSLINK